jgi:hypothetical protein
MFYFWYSDSIATVRSLKELHSYEKEVEREKLPKQLI